MKIYTKVVIDIETLEITSEESFEYSGPVAECRGGGSSGKVDYPDYMKAAHEDWLADGGVDAIEASVTAIMNAALGASPWVGQTAYPPDVDIANSQAAITAYAIVLAGVVATTSWDSLYTQAETTLPTSDAEIIAEVLAYSNNLTDEMNTRVLPRFRRGMQDINAVVSSAFPIGEAVIEAFRAMDVAKYESSLRLQLYIKDKELLLNATEQMLKLYIQRIVFQENYVRMVVEANRIKIVAKKEENDVNMEIDKDDALWDLEVFQYGGNLLASISGGTVGSSKPSKAASAIGGAMSGAATGAMIGGPVGGLIGGAVGLLGGLF